MESIINSLSSDKILLAILILLFSLMVYSILKRIVKLIIIMIIALVLYLGYIHYTGEKIDDTLQKYINQGGKELKDIQKKKDKINRVMNSVNEVSR